MAGAGIEEDCTIDELKRMLEVKTSTATVAGREVGDIGHSLLYHFRIS